MYICIMLNRLHNKMTMEVILPTAFSHAIDVQRDYRGKFYEAAIDAFAAWFHFWSGQSNCLPQGFFRF